MSKNWLISQDKRTRREIALRAMAVREFSEVEAAWLGAFIEADGSAFVRDEACSNVLVAQKDVEIISACLRITQVGNVQLDKGICWRWTVSTHKNALRIAQRCAPYSMKCQRVVAKVGI